MIFKSARKKFISRVFSASEVNWTASRISPLAPKKDLDTITEKRIQKVHKNYDFKT